MNYSTRRFASKIRISIINRKRHCDCKTRTPADFCYDCMSINHKNLFFIINEIRLSDFLLFHPIMNFITVFQVFCFFFFAAGKRILFNINRYPGELGCRFRSVGDSFTKCW